MTCSELVTGQDGLRASSLHLEDMFSGRPCIQKGMQRFEWPRYLLGMQILTLTLERKLELERLGCERLQHALSGIACKCG